MSDESQMTQNRGLLTQATDHKEILVSEEMIQAGLEHVFAMFLGTH